MKKLLYRILIIFCSFAYAKSETFEVDTLLLNGSTDKLINVVILGDGYTAYELKKFEKDAEIFGLNFLSERPFTEYQKYFNIFIIKTPSNVSGAALDPSALIDNFYGSTFNYGGIDRLLVPTKSSVIMKVLADNTPQYDQVMMLVNSDKYGGSGGWVSTSSTNTSAPEIVKHEFGHTFAGLADEYWAGDMYAGERVNQTRETDTNKVKWKKWLHEDKVGIYQHCCGGQSEFWYKPHENCKMQYLGPGFCPVCKERIIESIYERCSPILDFFPIDTTFDLSIPHNLFYVKIIPDSPYTMSKKWYLNSNIVFNLLIHLV